MGKQIKINKGKDLEDFDPTPEVPVRLLGYRHTLAPFLFPRISPRDRVDTDPRPHGKVTLTVHHQS